MIAQMADRCYLEKCRDRLYAEFVLGGMALPIAANGGRQVHYASGLDLLRQTPEFVAETRAKRLDGDLARPTATSRPCLAATIPTWNDRAQRRLSARRSCAARTGAARRNPPIFAAFDDPMATTRSLMLGYISKAWATTPTT